MGALSQSFQDLEKVLTVCTGLPDELSGSHLLCHITGLSSAQVNLYVDTTGWIVVFFDVNQPATEAARWTGSPFSSPGFDSPTGILDVAIKWAVDALEGDYGALEPGTGYFHFQRPEATEILVILKMRGGSYFFALPPSSTPIEISVSVFGNCCSGRVWLDGAVIAGVSSGKRKEAFVCTMKPPTGQTPCPGPVTLGEGHTIASSSTLVSSAIYVLWTGAGP